MRDFEQTQYYYLDKEKFKKDDGEPDKENEEYYPLSDYDIFFYGDNRVITLSQIEDNKNRGDRSLRYKYTDKNGRSRVTSLNLYFYQPKGSDKLVLIR